MQSELPHGVAEPLHLLEPEASSSGWYWLIPLLILALLTLLELLQRRRSRGKRPKPVPSISPPSGFEERIEALRSRADSSGDYRGGCHELSIAMRRRMEEVSGVAFTRWTALQIESRTAELAAGRVLEQVANAQFGRREPRSHELAELCGLALAVNSAGGFRQAAEAAATEPRPGPAGGIAPEREP